MIITWKAVKGVQIAVVEVRRSSLKLHIHPKHDYEHKETYCDGVMYYSKTHLMLQKTTQKQNNKKTSFLLHIEERGKLTSGSPEKIADPALLQSNSRQKGTYRVCGANNNITTCICVKEVERCNLQNGHQYKHLNLLEIIIRIH